MLGQRFKLYFKCTIYYLAKALGLFKLAIKLTENKNRILCYHGGAIEDEQLFEPATFISKKVFKNHLQLINKYKFNVLPLEVLVENIKDKQLPKRSLVLTFDDGFYSTTLLEPILIEANYPATLYVSTYYVTHQRPIFNLAVAYLFYKTTVETFAMALSGKEEQIFGTKGNLKQSSIKTILLFAKTLNEEQQNHLLQQIADRLNVAIDRLWDKRLFHNATKDELKALNEQGVFDIQLHTHRHNLPTDNDEFVYEIEKNRQILSEITGKSPNTICHFCYPSGLWNESQFPLLKKLGITSATTLDSGLNNADSNPLALKRILCEDVKPLIVFEAQLSGFNSILKDSANRLKNAILYKRDR